MPMVVTYYIKLFRTWGRQRLPYFNLSSPSNSIDNNMCFRGLSRAKFWNIIEKLQINIANFQTSGILQNNAVKEVKPIWSTGMISILTSHYQYAKNQLNSSIHSWNTDFWVPSLGITIFDHTKPKITEATFSFLEFG